MRDAVALAGLRSHVNVAAFLRVIRAGESSQDADAYRMQVGGRLLDSLDDHPREVVRVKIGGKVIPSSAAGAYQFIRGTWQECADALGLRDFSPAHPAAVRRTGGKRPEPARASSSVARRAKTAGWPTLSSKP